MSDARRSLPTISTLFGQCAKLVGRKHPVRERRAVTSRSGHTAQMSRAQNYGAALTAAPRVVIFALYLGGAATLAWATFSLSGGGDQLSGLRTAAVAVTSIMGGSVLVLARTARRASTTGSTERAVWWSFGEAALVVFGATALDAMRLLTAPANDISVWDAGVTGVAVVVAYPLLYRGIIVWNGSISGRADSGGWITGLSALFSAMAASNVMLGWVGQLKPGESWWMDQLVVLRFAALLVLVSLAVAVTTLKRRESDRRPLILSIACAFLLVLEVIATVQPATQLDSGLLRLGWLVLLATLALCTKLPPSGSMAQDLTVAHRAPRPEASVAAAQAMAMGQLVVLGFSVLVLAVAASSAATGLRVHHGGVVVTCSLLAICLTGTRTVRLIRELGTFALYRQVALTDELTGLANRRWLLSALKSPPQGTKGRALLVVDLDHFHVLNDRLGHQDGDQLLLLLSQRLQSHLGTQATLVHVASDKFAILLEHAWLEEAHQLATNVRKATQEAFTIGENTVHVTAKIGTAHWPTTADFGEELLRQAHTAAAWAKDTAAGVSIYDETSDREGRAKRLLAAELVASLAPDPGAAVSPQPPRSGFVAHYQPQIDVRTGHLIGVEALARWQHPRLGLLSPFAFLDLVEEQGLMPALTAHILKTAIAQQAQWLRQGLRVRMSVNLSTGCLSDTFLLPLLDEAIAAGLDPRSLVLEVTETTLMSNPELALGTCRDLAHRGVGISIDDFGTGYSSLAYLADLPATELKVDRAFTRRIAQDQRTAAIVSGTIDLAHHLGLHVVMEGVEDAASFTIVQAMGADESQGFLHSRPMPPEDLLAWHAALPFGCLFRAADTTSGIASVTPQPAPSPS